MKRTAAIAVIALGLLGACSGEEEATTTSTPTADVKTDVRSYTATDGATIEYDRLSALPAEMTADLQGRLDKVLYEPDVDAYLAAAATEAGAGPDTDNFLAFKGEAAAIGSETGKYVGGIIRVVQTCGEESAVTWGFAPQDMTTPQLPECGAADAKADALALADKYIQGALGGPNAWIIMEQSEAK